MAINLEKGQKINLTKEHPTMGKVTVGLGWDMAKSGQSIDVDASILMIKSGTSREEQKKKKGLFGLGKREEIHHIAPEHETIYYRKKTSNDKAIHHTGDNLTGEGDGDDEQLLVDLKKVSSRFDQLAVVINIFNAQSKAQSFGQIKNAYVHIVDEAGKELVRFNLTESYGQATGIIVGEFTRVSDTWEFKAIGKGLQVRNIDEFYNEY